MFKWTISILALVIAVIITAYFFYFTKAALTFNQGPFPMNWSVNLPEGDTAFGGLFAHPDINDSLPHYVYRRIEDSIKRIQDARQLENRSIMSSGTSNGAIGVFTLTGNHQPWPVNNPTGDSLIKLMEDSVNIIRQRFINQNNADSIKEQNKEIGDMTFRMNVKQNELIQADHKKREADQLHYFALNGYSMDYDTKFFIQNGTYNLAYVKWDSVIKRTYDSTRVGHYERKQISVRYATEDKRILIPVSKKQYQLLDAGLNIVWTGKLFLLVYFFIGLPVQVLINISKGDAFNRKNILRFKIMGYILFGYTLINMLFPYTLRFLFRKTIPPDFELQPFSQTLFNNLCLFLIAIALFIVGKAFQRGYYLQQEQALTI